MLGPLGILEPSPAAAELMPDIMLVPLAAFDRPVTASATAPAITTTRSRICARSRPIAAVGLAFAVQEIEAVPALPHDVALDYVLTETRT